MEGVCMEAGLMTCAMPHMQHNTTTTGTIQTTYTRH